MRAAALAPLAFLLLPLLLAGCTTPAPPQGPAEPPPAARAFDGLLEWNATGTVAFTLEIHPAPGGEACRVDWAAQGPSEALPPGIGYVQEDWQEGERRWSAGYTDGNGNHGVTPQWTLDAGPIHQDGRLPGEGIPWAARRAFDVQPAADASAFLTLAAFAMGPGAPVELGSQFLDEPTVWLNGSARLAVDCPGGNQVTFRHATGFTLFDHADFTGGAGATVTALVDVAAVVVQERLAFEAATSGHLVLFIGIDPEKHGRLHLDGPDADHEWVFVPTHLLQVVDVPGYVGVQQGPGSYTLTLDMVGGPVFGSIRGAFVDVGPPLDPWSLTPPPA